MITEVHVPHDVWAGIDAGKIAHHCVVINDAGEKLLSRKVSNDEADLLRLIGDVADLASIHRRDSDGEGCRNEESAL